MKKILFAVAVLAGTLCSCGNDGKSGATDSTTVDSTIVDSLDTVVVDSLAVDSVA